MNDKSDNQWSDSSTDKTRGIHSCATFDDISLCDNTTADDTINSSKPVSGSTEMLTQNKLKCGFNGDRLSMDLVSDLTPNSGSNSDEEDVTDQELNNLDIINEIKSKNGISFDAKPSEEKYVKQIIDLQQERNDLQIEIEDIRRTLKDKELNFVDLKTRLTKELDKSHKQNEITKRELESMVIKYANNEKEVILLKKLRDDYDRKLKDALKDKDGLRNRIKGLSTEKTQLMSALDRKVVELSQIQRDFDKLKDELKDRDLKWKQTINKLKEESNAHNETKSRLESSNQKVIELKAEADGLRQELHQLLNSNNESEISDKSLNNENDISAKIDGLNAEIEAYKKKISVYAEENHSLTTKIQTLERERLDHEQSVSKWKQTVNELELQLCEYQVQLRDKEQLKLQLDQQVLLALDLQKEIDRLKASNSELMTEMESCRHKEGELLEFTERLTAKTVNLQSEHNILEQKSVLLKEDTERLQKQFDELSKENGSLCQTIDEMKESHQKEIQILVKKLAEKTKLSEELRVKVDELENENRVNKRRHLASVKELNKELLSLRKRFEHLEISSNNSQTDCASIGSRTSSSNSLTDAMSASNAGLSSSQASNSGHSSHQKPLSVSISQTNSNSVDSSNTSVPNVSILPEVDKQSLIDRIIRLQKSLEKKNEKIDFLEEHNQQLVDEMKKKSKLIQHFIVKEESGALSTASMDNNKDKKKRQLAKRGTGIMSSLYNSAPNDCNMTLELSLEINRKLQAVLEDTILKNMTLKENLNTLGAEIERLSKEKK